MKKLLIKISNLEYTYPGFKNKIINTFSGEISSGEIIGVIGKNGVGKSTLMKLIASVHQPLSGNIQVNSIDSLDFNSRRNYLLSLVYLSHDKITEEDFTIQEYFDMYSDLYPNYSKSKEASLIEKFEFDTDSKISSLSTGNRMKVFLLFALASQAPLVLVDEITAVLDPENRQDFFELVKEYADLGVSFIVATNIVEDLDGFADRVWLIEKGCIKETSSENLNSYFKKKVA